PIVAVMSAVEPVTDPASVYVASLAVPETAPVVKSSVVNVNVLKNTPMVLSKLPLHVPRMSSGPAARTAAGKVDDARASRIALETSAPLIGRIELLREPRSVADARDSVARPGESSAL